MVIRNPFCFSFCFALSATIGAAQEWKPVPCFPDTYDLGAVGQLQGPAVFSDAMDAIGEWKALHGEQNAECALRLSTDDKKAGKAALAADYRFVGKREFEYVGIGRRFPIEKPGCGLALWVKGDGSGLGVRIRIVDSTGETFQFDLGPLAFTGWRRMGALIRADNGHWGGNNDGKIDYPCRFDSLLLDRPKAGFVGRGAILFDDLELIPASKEQAPALVVETRGLRPGNLYAPDEKIMLRAYPRKGTLGESDTVGFETRDYWDNPVAPRIASDSGASGEWTEGLPPEKAGKLFRIAFFAPDYGFYRLRIVLTRQGASSEGLEFRFGVLPPLEESEPKGPSPFGVCTHLQGANYPLEALELIARAGIAHIRDEMSWPSPEKEKGTFVFPPRLDEYIDRARSFGIQPLIILDYANRLYDDGNYPTSPEAIAGFARYASQVANRFKGRVKYYEVWNEYTGGCGMKGKPRSVPEVYARMIEPVYKAVKEADPDATVVGIGGDNPREEKHCQAMARMLKAGAAPFMDAASVHPYRYPQSPESTDLMSVLRKAEDIVKSAGGQKRLWITEVGWPTQLDPRGVSEQVQAQMLARTFLLALASGCVDKIFWYDFRDDGLERPYNEHNFGIVHNQAFNLAPKPAYLACAALIRVLAGATFDRALDLGDTARGFVFERGDGKTITALWSLGEPVRASWEGGATVIDIMGGERKLDGGADLTPDPIYIFDLKGPVKIEAKG
ncbi:MAG: cellulase family glycosylhydrolase [Candidatus Sumerlaeota bacterium]|nr:cellulase family glycosylhydrolase [Candidatus Sumerlaeota bacterium]